MSCLIIFRSITYAQSGNRILTKNGINSYLIRKPSAVAGNSCGYALRINCSDIERAKSIMNKSGVSYIGCWYCKGNNWYEL
ncbi:MAG: DUF3343 domain-containing protein [Clostridia bacterium]|nr:DUF3343 domain-containing protein [Clostridia bacterium]